MLKMYDSNGKLNIELKLIDNKLDRTEIKSLFIKRTERNYVVISSNLYMYFFGGSVPFPQKYTVKEILNSPKLLFEIQNSEFNLVPNYYYDKILGREVRVNELITETYLRNKFASENQEVPLQRKIEPSEITSFYLLEVDLVVKGIRIPYNHYLYYKYDRPDMLYVSSYASYKPLAVEEVRAPLDHLSKAYLVPLKDIDQIVGVKHYRDPSLIGKDDYSKFTGEKEEVVLDLNIFDMEVYQFFKDHDAVEIQFES